MTNCTVCTVWYHIVLHCKKCTVLLCCQIQEVTLYEMHCATLYCIWYDIVTHCTVVLYSTTQYYTVLHYTHWTKTRGNSLRMFKEYSVGNSL